MSHGRDDSRSGPYSPSDANGDSSSRAITSNLTTPGAPAAAPRTSNNPPSHNEAQRLGLGEHFNQPLRQHVWKSKTTWTKEDLEREREEFFETRVTGRAEIWRALKTVVGLVDMELETCQGILDASGITVPTGDLVNGAYDEAGNFYQIPERYVSDPVNIVLLPGQSRADAAKTENSSNGDEEEAVRRREEKGKGVLHSLETYTVKARLSDRGGPDVQITLGKEQNIRVLMRRVQEEIGILGRGKVKIAYMGKILKEGETLHNQGWKEGHVVNALVFN
ncbi:MAG: hypothetical protein M1812_001850 [Candelaria pacifica]|nr:MAG: hypothetical protein M1812_001850 [Candelaria pacifica]